MFKNYFVIALAVTLSCVMPVAAQSGRVRQLSYAERIRADASKPLSNTDADSISQAKTGASSKASSATVNSKGGKLASLVYNNNMRNQADQSDGDYHMTKGDRTAGYILLGLVVVYTIITIASGGAF